MLYIYIHIYIYICVCVYIYNISIYIVTTTHITTTTITKHYHPLTTLMDPRKTLIPWHHIYLGRKHRINPVSRRFGFCLFLDCPIYILTLFSK